MDVACGQTLVREHSRNQCQTYYEWGSFWRRRCNALEVTQMWFHYFTEFASYGPNVVTR